MTFKTLWKTLAKLFKKCLDGSLNWYSGISEQDEEKNFLLRKCIKNLSLEVEQMHISAMPCLQKFNFISRLQNYISDYEHLDTCMVFVSNIRYKIRCNMCASNLLMKHYYSFSFSNTKFHQSCTYFKRTTASYHQN